MDDGTSCHIIGLISNEWISIVSECNALIAFLVVLKLIKIINMHSWVAFNIKTMMGMCFGNECCPTMMGMRM